MGLSKNEVKMLMAVLGSKSSMSAGELSQLLGVSPQSTSRIITSLEKKGLLLREDGDVVLARTPHAESLKEAYYRHPASPFEKILSDRRVHLLSKIGEKPESVTELQGETRLPTSTLYYYFKDLIELGVVRKNRMERKTTYSFNYDLWSPVKEFADKFAEFEPTLKVPKDALLIKDYGSEVLFRSVKAQDANLTSFSMYEKFGIEQSLRHHYYVLPKRELGLDDVFIHSLDSAESITQRLYCIVFYLKNEERIRDVKHPMKEKVMAVLKGEQVKGYPSYDEVMDRAVLYGIQT